MRAPEATSSGVGAVRPPDGVLHLASDVVLRPARTGNAFEDALERLLQAVKLGVYPHGDRLPPSRAGGAPRQAVAAPAELRPRRRLAAM